MEWQFFELKDICLVTDYVANGSFASLSENVTYSNEPDYAILVRFTDFSKGWKKSFKYVSKEAYNFLNKSSLISGDLIMSNVGEPGKSFLLPDLGQPMTLGPNSILIRADESKTSNRFLNYYFSSNKGQGQIASIIGGTTHKKFNKTSFRSLVLSLPSIPEQKHIVAILDQAFSDIEQARAKTEQNLKNARELFESYLQQAFSQRGEGWTETNLGAVAGFKNGLNFSQSSQGEKLKVVGVKDFKSNFMVPFEQLDTIQIDGDLSEAYELKENDIITVRSNGNKRLIGRCLLMGKVDDKTSYSGFTIRIRLEYKSISPKFLAYYLKSSSTHELLINSGEGANISNLNQKILTSLPVAFPHLDKQMKLVEGIEKVELESQKLENIYANKLNTIDELKKSILQKAFSGELTKEKEGAVA